MVHGKHASEGTGRRKGTDRGIKTQNGNERTGYHKPISNSDSSVFLKT